MPAIDLTNLQRWIGKTETRYETLGAFPANALSATLDQDDAPFDTGAEVPPLWHWLYFLDLFKLSDAGYDGHAALGGFLPPVPLPRRMWAGSRLRFLRPLRIGEAAEKRSEIVKVNHRQGRSGDLVFVTVKHLMTTGGQPAIDEEHDIVYRAPPAPDAPVSAPPIAEQEAQISREITPSEVLLFRYSALTFNGHRIHYDETFCRDSEGYDGLVVHGPLLATLMLDLMRRAFPERRVATFTFRAQAPVTGMRPFSVNTAVSGAGGQDIWITRHDGAEAMRGHVTFVSET